MVICLKRGADLHMAQLMPLPLTVSCFSKIQIGFTFLVLAHLGSPGNGPLNGCVLHKRISGLRKNLDLTFAGSESFGSMIHYLLTSTCVNNLPRANTQLRPDQELNSRPRDQKYDV